MRVDFASAGPRPQGRLSEPPIHEWRLPDGSPWTRFHRTPRGYLLRFPEIADFEVSRDGASVRAWAVPGVPEESVEQVYLNQVLPLALSRLGRLVFHAAAVEIGDGAVALMGASGRGKSTLAASFATHGRRFLSDDGLVVDFASGSPVVVPSHPSIRLWDDSREAVIGASVAAAPPVHFTSKGRFLAGDEMVHCAQVLPLSRVYVLGERAVETTRIEPVAAAEALIELVKHSFLIDIAERELLAAHFERLSRLASAAACFRLEHPRRFESLAGVREAITAHAEGR